MVKNKIALAVLMSMHVFTMYSAPIVESQSYGFTADELDYLETHKIRKTIPQRVQAAWKNLDRQTKETIYGGIASLVVCAIMMRMQERSIMPEHFKVANPHEINTTFDKIIGAQDVKDELRFYIDYIKNPKPFHDIGATPEKGILLEGLPGTAKTDLARAMAKEAGVPFLHLTGSDFNGVYRGSGVAQIRKLEKRIKELGSCVVFIDEIDGAVGGHSDSVFGGSDSQQTTNAFKTWLDGFGKQDPKNPVLVIGATNNLKNIDPAIIRDGRLTPIHVGPPNVTELGQIFASKFSGFKVEPGIDTQALANLLNAGKDTGAAVAAIVNKAARFAVQQGKKSVDNDCLHKAIAQRTAYKKA